MNRNIEEGRMPGLNEKVTVNERISRMIVEMRRLGYSEETIWREYYPSLANQ